MESVEQHSLWHLLGNFTQELEYKRLGDVFRTISFCSSETYNWHEHLRIEVNFVQKGTCILHLENESVTFKENELMIISPNIKHAFEAGPEGATLLQLEFLPEIFLNFGSSNDLSELNPVDIFSQENRLIKIVNNVRIMRSVQRIVNELNSKKEYSQQLVVMYYAELFILICRHMNDIYLPICTNDTLQKAIRHIHLNYQSELSVTDLAIESGVGERYLRKLFSQHLDTSPLDYLNQIRINNSKELLKNTEMSIKEICFNCGFKSPQYFSRVFKKEAGLSPKEFRQ